MAQLKQTSLGIKVWGCRGSIPCSSPEIVQFGGNTSCYEVLQGGAETILIDAGTGIYPLGEDLVRRKKGKAIGRVHVFLSHLHWDHIQGLACCPLVHSPSTELIFYSHHGEVEKMLRMLFQPQFFPVSWEQVGAKISFRHLKPGTSVKVDTVDVHTTGLHHPGGSLGYKFASGKSALAVVTDHEVDLVDGAGRKKLGEFLSDASLILHDGMFTSEERIAHSGWGHSSVDQFLELCATLPSLGHRHLIATHHRPYRTDKELSQLETHYKKRTPFMFEFAREGVIFRI